MKRIFVIIAALIAIRDRGGFRLGPTTADSDARARPAANAGRRRRVPAVNVPPSKIAFVDTTMFGDEKSGIRRYINAVKTVQSEFRIKQQELLTLQNRIKTIADEISRLSGNTVVDPKSIQAKQDEGERLQRDFKYKKEQFDADVEKRYKELVGPVSTEIGKALDQFATQNGITMIMDISKLLQVVMTINSAVDVTQQFIADFNAKNP